ncbi:TetR-like C-terminal domain-containing protein [Actinoplanes sp. NPDC051513]|uniref:TetR-like C-terminal domain-containing protein n=1 Tax=Actinoplanes sp. NPDC051513 TaxID=3363908 RepID=UPI0037B9B8A6
MHADLLALSLLIRDNAELPKGRALVEAVQSGPDELRELVETMKVRALTPFRRVLDRAGARGEIAPEADLAVIAYLAFYGVVLWGQIHGGPPTDEDCARIIRTVLP